MTQGPRTAMTMDLMLANSSFRDRMQVNLEFTLRVQGMVVTVDLQEQGVIQVHHIMQEGIHQLQEGTHHLLVGTMDQEGTTADQAPVTTGTLEDIMGVEDIMPVQGVTHLVVGLLVGALAPKPHTTSQ
ncbi:unnamed protein product [Meganyctiphanes norvegica]|uniref:Uncharacterized protein n=1 Tax=Meganyctiphanes norvegica TaxID=48144 RepID=A0AAV2PN20_MEGNR